MGRRRNWYDDNKWLIVTIGILVILWLLGSLKTDAAETTVFDEPTLIRATCYVGDGVTASGQNTRPHIMASKAEYLGYVACVNAVNEDGSVGEFIGFYEITDTGYGAETGEGQSTIFSDRTMGTIEAGKTVDIWMPTTHQAEEWIDEYGDYLYIKLVKGEG